MDMKISLRANKYGIVANALLKQSLSVADVGCRDGVLKKFLAPQIKYVGIDIQPGEHVTHIGNIEKGLPIADRTFDAVVALDILEHTDNIWGAFNELVRLAKYQVIISLPNMYHWWHRANFVLGREMNKYRLTATPVEDRHRWLPSFSATESFSQEMALRSDLTCDLIGMLGSRRHVLLDALFLPISKDLAVWTTVVVFAKRDVYKVKHSQDEQKIVVGPVLDESRYEHGDCND